MGAGTATMAIKDKNMTIRTNAAEYGVIQDFARFQGKTVSGFVMDAVWEKIEDWEDIRAAEAYLKKPDKRFVSNAELAKELGLE